MPMRGILVAVACAVGLGGCGCSERKLLGRTDADVDADDDIDRSSPGTCGNGIVEGSEECDDGDDDDCNGCTSACTWERALQADFGAPGSGVTVENVPCVPCPFTIEFWFRLDDSRGVFTPVDIPGLMTLTVWPSGYELDSIARSGNEPWPSDVGSLAPGTWHHFSYGCWPAYGGGLSTDWHLDGKETGGECSGTGLSYSCGTPMRMGSSGSSTEIAHGSVDDVRISNTDRYHYIPYEPERYHGEHEDTVALWTFDQAVGGEVRDVTGNGHDALLEDGTLVPDDCHRP